MKALDKIENQFATITREKIMRICLEVDQYVNGTVPSEWIGYAIQEPKTPEGDFNAPLYIRAYSKGESKYDWGCWRYVRTASSGEHLYTSGTHTTLIMSTDLEKLETKFNPMELDYKKISDKEFLLHFLNKAEDYRPPR